MSDDEEAWSLDAQRRAFEAQFGSLESMGFQDNSKADAESSASSSDDSDASDFGGFSDDDDNDNRQQPTKPSRSTMDVDSDSSSESEESSESEDEAPRVVRLGEPAPQSIQTSKKDRRLLKSGRAPTLAEIEAQQQLAAKQQEKELRRKAASGEDAENLENDLALQRLLKESHILAHHLEYSGADLTLKTIDHEEPTGKARKRILDHRIREISAVNSSTGGLPKRLEKMPMQMRKGMIDAQARRVAKHEKEAREAGIVLARVRKGQTRELDMGRGVTARSDRLGTGIKKKKTVNKRDRGLRIQAVGRSTANGLVISEREIARVSNSSRGGKSRRR